MTHVVSAVHEQTFIAALDPIALSVRATNVYEEKSLGVYEEEEEGMEPDIEGPQPGMLGSYLAWHARRQLAFGMQFALFSTL